MTASTIWTAVKTSYETNGLITLTNLRDRSATAIDDTAGEDAAQEVIDLWPVYAQEAYDATDAAHLAVAKQATIAVLWRRGGSSTSIAEVKWNEVFSSEGLLAKVRGTGARARSGPKSNSDVSTTRDSRRYRGWADRDAYPTGFLPNRSTSNE